VGEGDPALDREALGRLADRVVEATTVAELRALHVDDTAFSASRLPPGFDADGPGPGYQAPSGALSLEFNAVAVTVYPVRGSRALAVRVDPSSAHVRVESSATVGPRDALRVISQEDRGRTEIRVSGTLRAGARAVVERRRIHDPGLHAGAVFAQMLADRTATAPLAVTRAEVPGDAEPLAAHVSPELVELVADELAFSNNVMAEQILRTVAWRMTGEPGDWSSGAEVLRSYWSALGHDPTGLQFENGSGLSREGRVSSSALVDLISMAEQLREAGPALADVLPVAGEAGTMRARLRLSGKRVRAKTGTMDGVSGLSGVITSEAGVPQVAFSILINARPDGQPFVASERRAVEDRVVLTVLRYLDDWARRAALAPPAPASPG
jgi:D-alanyl-D-alanine carboxypeptidase/D-alanyl-D-alanine-endopeptidase (penicillin-binding protein 4)